MIGSGELIVILCVILLLFGGKKLPEFAKNLGKGIREFKKACHGVEEEEEISSSMNPHQKNNLIAATKDEKNSHEG
jgi:sec-independent protein translocase protein TatA